MVSHYLQSILETRRSISMILVLGLWVLLPRLGIALGLLLKFVYVICKCESILLLHFITECLFQGYQLYVRLLISKCLMENIRLTITVEVVRHLQ